MTLPLRKRRVLGIALAVVIAWPMSLWAVGYNSAKFVRDSSVRNCNERSKPRDRANAAVLQASAVAWTQLGEFAAAGEAQEAATQLQKLAAASCEELYPPPPIIAR